jgi:hypothetical protein
MTRVYGALYGATFGAFDAKNRAPNNCIPIGVNHLAQIGAGGPLIWRTNGALTPTVIQETTPTTQQGAA